MFADETIGTTPLLGQVFFMVGPTRVWCYLLTSHQTIVQERLDDRRSDYKNH
jgi:hypothetical protein